MMGHCTPKPATDPHAGHAMPGPSQAAPAMEMTGTALPAGNAPPPQPPADHYADRQFPPEEMADARRQMMFEQGGQPFYQVMFNLAEYQAREGADGFRQRLDLPPDTGAMEYGIYADLREQGYTDYVALPMQFTDGRRHATSWSTRRAGADNAGSILGGTRRRHVAPPAWGGSMVADVRGTASSSSAATSEAPSVPAT